MEEEWIQHEASKKKLWKLPLLLIVMLSMCLPLIMIFYCVNANSVVDHVINHVGDHIVVGHVKDYLWTDTLIWRLEYWRKTWKTLVQSCFTKWVILVVNLARKTILFFSLYKIFYEEDDGLIIQSVHIIRNLQLIDFEIRNQHLQIPITTMAKRRRRHITIVAKWEILQGTASKEGKKKKIHYKGFSSWVKKGSLWDPTII